MLGVLFAEALRFFLAVLPLAFTFLLINEPENKGYFKKLSKKRFMERLFHFVSVNIQTSAAHRVG